MNQINRFNLKIRNTPHCGLISNILLNMLNNYFDTDEITNLDMDRFTSCYLRIFEMQLI
jgi:hypothetical protein